MQSKLWKFALLTLLAGGIGGVSHIAAAQEKPFLTVGQSLAINEYVSSPSKTAFAIMQSDGNFCLYKGTPAHNLGGVWCSRNTSAGAGPYTTIMQSDGNLVTYRTPNVYIWGHQAPGIAQSANWRFEVTDTPNMLVRDTQTGKIIWEAPDNLAIATKYAPELRLDRASEGYPMSAQPFYEIMKSYTGGYFRVENNFKASLSTGTTPTYYQFRQFGNQVRIHYWWFYGYQNPCFTDLGSHNGDWEHVMVTLNEAQSAIAAVTYYQHGDSYTRIAGPRDAPCTPDGTGRCAGSHGFPSDGTHPIVYSGKIAHGSFHDSNSIGAGTFDACAYYGDYRNPSSSADYLQSWSKLINLDGSEEAWIADDRTATWTWGPDGISNHPTQHPPTGTENACSGSPTFAVASAGCYQSECLAGDDQASEDCIKECKPGYTNVGLTCNTGKWPWEWKIYGRLTGGNLYNYNYQLPHGDAGLTRRRSSSGEWSLP